MNPAQILETLWKTYDTINGHIKFSDTKAAAVLASSGFIYSTIISKFIDNKDFIIGHPLLLSVLIFGFILGFASICFSILCLNPRMVDNDPKSLIFFRDIAKKYENYDDYKEDILINFGDDEKALNQMTQQVWVASSIAAYKYNYVKFAALSLIIGIGLILLAGLIAIHTYQIESHLQREFLSRSIIFYI